MPSGMLTQIGGSRFLAQAFPAEHPMDGVAETMGFSSYTHLLSFLDNLSVENQSMMLDMIERVIRGELPR